ncbi:MAG: hypothetical protein M3294_05940, partial [Pseudomonadota bacterium]|nr:hypothetical protein [Pseudomonadota bacterium]
MDISIHLAVCKHEAGLLWMRITCQIAYVGSLLIWPLTPVLPKAAIGCGSISPHIRIGYTSLAGLVFAYALVMTEELTRLRKSEPVTLAAGLIWLLIGLVYTHDSDHHAAVLNAAEEALIEYAEMLLFLLAAMTYVNT